MTSFPARASRYASIGHIAASVRRLLRRSLWPLIVAAAVIDGYLVTTGRPGAAALALIVSGSLIVLGTWTAQGEGLPILPLVAMQNIAVYAVPIAIGNPIVRQYSETAVTSAAWEVFVFSLAMVVAWRLAMAVIRTGSATCYALQDFDDTAEKAARLGVALVVGGTTYEVLRASNLLATFLDLLPAGSVSILSVLVSVASACGFFLTAMMVGRGNVSPLQRALFWGLLALQCFIKASGFLLSASVTVLFAAIIGLFWGSGRMPWRFIAVAFLSLGFLNAGKFVMRERYWPAQSDLEAPQFTLAEMPRYYGEWVVASTELLSGQYTGPDRKDAFSRMVGTDDRADTSAQSLLERMNDLQSLLFVARAVQVDHVALLDGATYSLIPPLLVPRILWPDKPRTHEGQVLLNVHFGRQDLQSTFRTYIAWGLLPEAYANFGPLTGAIVLGVAFGTIFAWIEKFGARKLILSLEGFLLFTVFLGMVNSFEMVASVLVTSVFQACVPVLLAAAPLVAPFRPVRAKPAAEAEEPVP